jgi:predicted RNase H-related nuclease YkuK (DUF458 family)
MAGSAVNVRIAQRVSDRNIDEVLSTTHHDAGICTAPTAIMVGGDASVESTGRTLVLVILVILRGRIAMAVSEHKRVHRRLHLRNRICSTHYLTKSLEEVLMARVMAALACLPTLHKVQHRGGSLATDTGSRSGAIDTQAKHMSSAILTAGHGGGMLSGQHAQPRRSLRARSTANQGLGP